MQTNANSVDRGIKSRGAWRVSFEFTVPVRLAVSTGARRSHQCTMLHTVSDS